MCKTNPDMELLSKISPPVSGDSVPLELTVGSHIFRGLPETGIKVNTSDNGSITTVFSGCTCGLDIRIECITYPDFPVTEWIAYITNPDKQNSELITNLCITPDILPGSNPMLRHYSGDVGERRSFDEYLEPLFGYKQITPIGGRPCNGASAYMRVLFEDYGVNLAIGWSGQWRADFIPKTGGVELRISQQRLCISLMPGETIRTPRFTMMAFHGGEVEGANLWRKWFCKYILTRQNGEVIKPKQATGDMVNERFVDISEKQQIASLQKMLDSGIKPDIWWTDTGWYECNDGNWRNTGTFKFDTKRFPDGLYPVGKLCKENGIEFMLWFEPERVRKGTELANEHPEWLLKRNSEPMLSDMEWITHPGMRCLYDSMLLDLGREDCFAWLLERLDSIIKQNGINIYRQDFNFNPLAYWIDNEEPNRIGALENKHVTNYLRLWAELIKRNPGLIIDSCASGGRRNDLDTMRTPSIPITATDFGHGDHPFKQAEYHYMFQWMPYFKGDVKNGDDETGSYGGKPAFRDDDAFAWYNAMCPIVCMSYFCSDVINESQLDETKRLISIWRRATPLMMNGEYYPLTKCRKDSTDWYAVQFHDKDNECGYILIIRNVCAKDDEFTLYPILGEEEYVFHNSEGGNCFTMNGANAVKGVKISLEKRSATILFYNRQT